MGSKTVTLAAAIAYLASNGNANFTVSWIIVGCVVRMAVDALAAFGKD